MHLLFAPEANSLALKKCAFVAIDFLDVVGIPGFREFSNFRV
jgi:hypothetical protein